MRILFVGGSNTVMTNGYVTTFSRTLSSVLKSKELEIVNLGVGGNSSIHGVEIMKSTKDLGKFHFLVIEYCVNDASLASNTSWQSWQSAYEGLIRIALAENPQIRVYLLAFGRKGAEPGKGQSRIFSHLPKLRAFYRKCGYFVGLIDIDRYLRELTANDAKTFNALYMDGAHYSRPITTELIGLYLAHAMRPLKAQSAPSAPLPPPLCPSTFDQTGLGEFSDLAPALPRHQFKNSRYTFDTTILEPGSSLTLTIPGSLVAFSFASAGSGATLLVEEEGEAPITLYTRHHEAGIRAKFTFLIRQFAFEWKKWDAAAASQPRRVTFRVLAAGEQEQEQAGARHVPRYHMEPPLPEGQPQAFLARLMYWTGTAALPSEDEALPK